MTYLGQNSLSITSKVSPISIIFSIGKVPLVGSYPMETKAPKQHGGFVD
jgi:hypothetical protein